MQHILDETSYLGANLPGLDREEFLRNPTLQRAFVRSIEVIGEAAKQIPDSLRENYPAHIGKQMERGIIRIRRKLGVTRLRLWAHSNRATYCARYFL
ncbi:MAG: HepT-like ribonuclease domain-containing protein, partial [Candidatus Competibacteraceae bacterium]